MKKFHWGHGIALFYVVFVGALITALVASFDRDRSLVDQEYYQRDIEYQSTYEKTVNAMKSDAISISANASSDIVTVKVTDAERVNGTIHFYRPSDEDADFMLPIEAAHSEIATGELRAGKWIVKLDLTADGVDYHKEEVLIL